MENVSQIKRLRDHNTTRMTKRMTFLSVMRVVFYLTENVSTFYMDDVFSGLPVPARLLLNLLIADI